MAFLPSFRYRMWVFRWTVPPFLLLSTFNIWFLPNLSAQNKWEQYCTVLYCTLEHGYGLLWALVIYLLLLLLHTFSMCQSQNLNTLWTLGLY